MQDPHEGVLKTAADLFGDEKIRDEFKALKGKSAELEKATGKAHPVFSVGEIVTVKGGRFRVRAIRKNRLMLKPVRY